MFLTTGGVFFSMGVKVGIKYNKYVAHNFTHNGAVLRVTLKSIIPKFSSIMNLTKRGWSNPTAGLSSTVACFNIGSFGKFLAGNPTRPPAPVAWLPIVRRSSSQVTSDMNIPFSEWNECSSPCILLFLNRNRNSQNSPKRMHPWCSCLGVARALKCTLFSHASALNKKCSNYQEIGDTFVVSVSTCCEKVKSSGHVKNLLRLVPVLHGARILPLELEPAHGAQIRDGPLFF